MLSPTDDYVSLYASFEWRVPQFYISVELSRSASG